MDRTIFKLSEPNAYSVSQLIFMALLELARLLTSEQLQ